MGLSDWLWQGSSQSSKDPTKNLDPSLKEFLDQQKPSEYKPTPPPDEQKTAEDPGAEAPNYVKELPDTNKIYDDRPLPKASLYQDGRYAHLWKTYTPESELVSASESPTDRLNDLFQGRKSRIQDAALENCAEENMTLDHCFHIGDWKDRAIARTTMCRKQNRAFLRCYTLQAKFLHALGYAAILNKSHDEQNEKIQMHADKLYHRMIAYEDACREAREKGLPEPPPFSVFNAKKPVPPAPELDDFDKKRIGEENWEKMSPQSKELTFQTLQTERQFVGQYKDEIYRFFQTEYKNRQWRQGKLVGMFGETVGKHILPDAPPPKPRQDVPSGMGPKTE
ncbi:MAG: hypothetical protein Q9227_003326 [Pyrenula ochraceoflavens]